jgi:hypothetical protein
MVRRRRSTTRGGARGGVQDLAMTEPSVSIGSGASGSVKRTVVEQGGGRIG